MIFKPVNSVNLQARMLSDIQFCVTHRKHVSSAVYIYNLYSDFNACRNLAKVLTQTETFHGAISRALHDIIINRFV